jgi:hypothetical protein
MPESETTFSHVSEVLLEDSRVSESTVFGSPCLAVAHKAFVIFYRDNLVVRLRSERARELIDTHEGHKFDPLESGWALEGWVRLAPDYGRHEKLWESLAKEARDYAVASVDPNQLRTDSVVMDASRIRSDLAEEEVAAPPPEAAPPVDASPPPAPPVDTDPSTSISLEFTLEELEELAALAPGVEQGADERVRSALHKLLASLESGRAVSAVRKQLSESGFDTSHMSDEQVVALGRRISQTALDASPE